MSYIELNITVEDDENVTSALTNGVGNRSTKVNFDDLRKDTIKIFEDWLSQGKITRRSEFEVLGTHLFDIIFNGDVKTAFLKAYQDAKNNKNRLRVQLTFREKAVYLSNLPWEYLFIPDKVAGPGCFMSTNTNLVLSRFVPTDQERDSSSLNENDLTLLVLISQPVNLPPVPNEKVISELKNFKNIKLIELPIPTVGNFIDKLTEFKPKIVHFIGHGRYNNEKKISEIGLIDPDERSVLWISPKDFTECFTQSQEIPHLVFLQLCDSGEPDFTGNFVALGHQLAVANIPATVALKYPFTDEIAQLFCKAFYKKLLIDREHIDDAVQFGRYEITYKCGQPYDNRLFGTPVLYLRSKDGCFLHKSDESENLNTSQKPTPTGRNETLNQQVGKSDSNKNNEQINTSIEDLIKIGKEKMKEWDLNKDQESKIHALLFNIDTELLKRNEKEKKEFLLEIWNKEENKKHKEIIKLMIQSLEKII